MSKDKSEKPFIFYFAPENQDIDRMLDENYKQCLTYYQTTWVQVGIFIDVLALPHHLLIMEY